MADSYLTLMRDDTAPAGAGSPSATGSSYGDLMRAEIDGDKARLGASATLAGGADPDQAARQKKVAGFLGVAPGVVSAAPQDAERQARTKMLTQDSKDAPVLRHNYMDPEFMRLANDDSGVLSGIERVVRRMMTPTPRPEVKIDPIMSGVQFSDTVRRMVERNPVLSYDEARLLVKQNTQIESGPIIGQARGPAPTASNIMRGMFSADRFRALDASLGIMASDALGMGQDQAIRKYETAKSRADARDPEFETATGSALYGAGVSFVDNSPGLALSIITGSPIPGLALAGGRSGGDAYGKYRARGGTPGQATLGSLLEGGIEIGTEMLPMRFMVDRLGKAGATEFVKGLLAREVPGEQLATLAQDAVDTAIANPDKTWSQYIAERPEAAYKTLIATIGQSGLMGGVHRVAQKIAGPQAQAERADTVANDVQELTQLLAASKLRERDASTFQDFMRQVTEAGDAPTELFVDAQMLANTLQQSGVTIEELRALAPSAVTQLESGVPGADVRLPVAEIAALGPDLSTALVDHLREAPDAMSRAEAQQFMTEHGQRIQQETERALARQQEGDAHRQQVEQATARFQQELDTLGRFPAKVNEAYAALLGNFYATQAARAGVPLEQFMEDYRLRLVKQTKAGALLDQEVPVGKLGQGPVETPAFRTWFGDSQVVDAEGKPLVVYHGTDQSFDEFRGNSYFTPVPEDASKYSSVNTPGKEHTPNVMPVYLSMRNPKVIPTYATRADIDDAREAGFDGVIVRGVGGSKIDHYITFQPKQVKSATGNDGSFDAADPSVLSQADDAQITRGSFDPSTSTIALLAGADLSTFIHEAGHFFLEVQADLAAKIQAQISAGASVTPAEQAIVDDFNTILQWFGVADLDTWVQMTLEEKRAHHEKWARGFERFNMEGQAPTLELQPLFARFRAWLVQVYKTLTALNVELSDDVRAVMNRMLASDVAIAEAQDARNMGPMFRTPEQAGMTPEEYASYQALGERATAKASAELDAKLMKDMKWLSRARDKALKAAQESAAAARKEVELEVRGEVMSEPVYRAWAFLTGRQNRLAPGRVAAEDIDTTEWSGRLRTTYVKALDTQTAPDGTVTYPLWERLTKLGMTSEEWGMDPDIVASLFGFASGEQLVRALAMAPTAASVIQELTDFRTLQRHGDITSPEALARAADEAVHNELRARVIAAELKALAKAGRVTESGDSLVKQRDTISVMTRAARQFAEQVIARVQIKNLRPKQYAAAETRSAKLAEQALGKSTEEAAMHKRNQLVNNHATKAAYEAKAEVNKGIEFFRKVVKGARDDVAKTRDWDIVQAARAVLADYGVGSKGDAARSYLDTLASHDPATKAVLQDRIDALTANAKPINELTVEEFRALRDEIASLWYLAKRSRQVEIDGKLVDIESAKIPLVERMEAIGVPDTVPGEGKAVTDAERRLAKLRTLGAALRRVESWADAKDGGKRGPFRRFIWEPVKEAADRYRADKAKHLKKYQALLAALDVGQQRIEAPELGYTFGYSRGGSGKAEILHAILHTGNQSNLRKLLLGRGWASERADGTLDTSRWDAFVKRMIDTGVLTKADFDFAQGVWDLLEEMKPLAQKTHRDVFGRYFDEITADPFTNEFGTYRGGYVPAMTDPEVVKDAATRKLQEDENQTLAYAFPSTNRGFTKSRVEYNAPLLLDLRTISQHIDKVLLFSHLEQPIRDVRRILTSQAVSQPLHRIDPAAFDSLLTPWLNRSARQQVETPVAGDNGLMRVFSRLRSNAGMAAMFANVSNAAQQITGFSLAALKVGFGRQMSATADWAMDPRKFARAVAESSPYMASRMENEVSAMNAAIDDILLNPSVYEKAQAWTAKHAYFIQSAVDNVMGPIIWTAAYNQALEQGETEQNAIRAGDAAVRQTQGSTLPEDVSNIETGSAFVRMFTQFAGYFNMQANLLGTEFANLMHEGGLRAGMGRGLYVFTFGFIVPAVLAQAIATAFRGGPDDDDKDGSYLDDWLMTLFLAPIKNALAFVPGAGQVANAAIATVATKNPSDDRMSVSPAVSMIEAGVKAPYEVYKAVVDDKDRRTAVRDLSTLISVTTGLPATAIARPVGYAAAVDQGKVRPTGPVDATRGAITGTASPESKR